MAREKKGRSAKKMPKCLTCLIINLVIIAVFIVALIVGANVAFNSYVSPMIGGVKLSNCLKLIRGIYKADRDKIVTSEFSAQDLDDFYFTLNSMLYQKSLSEEEYSQRYNALSEEERAGMTLEQYKDANPYRITMDSLMGALPLDELTGNQSQPEQVAAAAETEGEDGSDSGANSELTALFKDLSFDFSTLKEYPYTQETEDTAYTTFQITGNEVAALIAEILDKLLSSFSLAEVSPDLEGVSINEYVGIPQITTAYTKKSDEADYDKSVKLTMILEVKIKDMINSVVTPVLTSKGLPKTIVNIVKTLLPKQLFLSLGVYPLNNTAEASVIINNYTEEMAADLRTIVNALTSNSNITLFGGEGNDENDDDGITPTEDSQSTGLFTKLNTTVTDIFTKINDFVPVSFVSNEEGSATLRVAHIQGLLSLVGLFDPENLDDSVTPHMFLTTLRCLFDEASAENNTEELTSLYAQLEKNYGIDQTFWEEHSLLDTDTLSDLPSQIDVSTITFEENASMKVYMHEGQLTALVGEAVKSGLFGGEAEETAAAAEAESENALLDNISFESIKIKNIDTGNISDYSYIKEDGGNSFLALGKYTVYTLDIAASISLTELLSSATEEGEGDTSDMLKSLSESLPQKLTLAIVLHVKDITNPSGELFRRVIGGEEAGKTTFKVNKFDEGYTAKVIKIIQLLMSKMGGGESEFNTDSITSTIEEGFSTVFNTVSDTLYCTIGFSEKDELDKDKGCMVLPSLYEVIYGFSTKQIEEDDTLSLTDRLSIQELQELFANIYNSNIVVLDSGEDIPEPGTYTKLLTRYSPDESDAFLSDLSDKYYLKTEIDSSTLFAENGFDDLITADSLNFKGYTDTSKEPNVYVKGMYEDTDRDIADLDVPLSGGALAALINASGKLDELSGEVAAAGEEENDLIKKLEIITCTYTYKADSNQLWLNFEFLAKLTEDEPAAAAEEEPSFSLDSFMPSSVNLTATVLLYAEDYTSTDRFTTTLKINNDELTKLSKLVKVFSGGDFSEATITDQVKDAISGAFDTIEQSINFKYQNPINNTPALSLCNVFNTVNKLSNKDNATYVASAEDDSALRAELMEFGRAPSYGVNGEGIVNRIDTVSYYSPGASQENVYSLSDADVFFDSVNSNFYISAEQRLNTEKVKNLDSVGTDLIDFNSLYHDTRAFSEIVTHLTNVQFTALASSFFEDGIVIEGMGYANVIQTRITPSFLELIVMFTYDASATELAAAEEEDPVENIMPSHLFITCRSDLIATDEFGKKLYTSQLIINNFSGPEKTEELFDRITLLQNSLDMDFGISLDTLTQTIEENVAKIFEDYFSMFGELDINYGYIGLPNVFQYLVGGTLEDGEYNKEKKMYEMLPGSDTVTYAIKDNVVGYYESDEFIPLKVQINSTGTIAPASAVLNNGIWGYNYFSTTQNKQVFVNVQTDPNRLMLDLRMFGNKPAETPVTISNGANMGYYNTKGELVTTVNPSSMVAYKDIGINLVNSEDYFYLRTETSVGSGEYYFKDDAAEFMHAVNTNYYIADSKQLSVSALSSGVTIDQDMFDFSKLYSDTRPYEQLKNRLSGSRLGALANSFYPEGIDVSGGTATIVQMHIFAGDNKINGKVMLRTVIRVELEDTTNSGVLPECIYLVCLSDIDPDSGEEKYNSELIINSFGYSEEIYGGLDSQIADTQAFLNRLNVLKANFEIDFDFDINEIKATIKEKMGDIFEKKLSSFGTLTFEDNAIIIPNVFEYLTGGTLEEGEYNKEKKMFEVFPTLSDGTVYAVLNNEVGHYVGADFVPLTVTIDSYGTLDNATAITENGVIGYRYYSISAHEEVFVNIQTYPKQLMQDLRMFGNKPAENVVTINSGSTMGYTDIDGNLITSIGSSNIVAYNNLGINLNDSQDYFNIEKETFSGSGVYYYTDDAEEFMHIVNTNYYIADSKQLSVSALSLGVTIDKNMFDFSKLYADTRPYEQLKNRLSGNRLGALSNSFYPDGIDVSGGTATIVQMHVYGGENKINGKVMLRTIIRVELVDTSGLGVLPEYIYLVCLSDIDPNSGLEKYDTELIINSFGYNSVLYNGLDTQITDTQAFLDRLNVLKTNFGLEFEFNVADIKATLKEKMGEIFEEKLSSFGTLTFEDNAIIIPNVFEYLTGGTLEEGEYNKEKKMFEVFPTLSDGTVYAVLNNEVGHYVGADFVPLTVTIDGDGTLGNAIATTENGVIGYRYYSISAHEEVFVNIQTYPKQLMQDLRMFGNKPAENVVTINSGSTMGYTDINGNIVNSTASSNLVAYNNLGINLNNSQDYFNIQKETFSGSGVYYYTDDAEEFMHYVNTNYYIADNKQLSVFNLSSGVTIDEEMFDFSKLYSDTRPYEQLKNRLSGNRLGALSNSFYPTGIAVSGGTATIVQMHVYGGENKINGKVMLRTIIRVKLEDTSGLGVLPEYIYLVCLSDIDPDSGLEKYDTELIINSFGYNSVLYNGLDTQITDTQAFLDRLNVLKANFGLEFEFNVADIKATLKEKMKEIFEEKLSSFGTLAFEDNAILIPNIFQYLTDGKLDNSSGKTVYNTNEKMLEADGTTYTQPTVLRQRLLELGNDNSNANGSLTVWYNGAPDTRDSNSTYYNDNKFLDSDSGIFYSDMQAYYFLKNTPNSTWFTSGSDVLSNLNTNLENTFNLSGKPEYDTLTAKNTYFNKGLYNYNGTQISPKLSDKALGALIKEQSDIDLSSTSCVQSIEVTSVKLKVLSSTVISIQMTIKVFTKDADYLPSYFFLTTETLRTAETPIAVYATTVTVNRFAPDDFNQLKANMNHLSTLGLGNQLETESIANAVENALKTLFDEKLTNYTSGYGNFNSGNVSENGVGYIEFRNFYDVMLDKINPSEDSVTATSATDLQNIIVKLHNLNEHLLDNQGTSPVMTDSISLYERTTINDHELAYMLGSAAGIDVCQSVIFTLTSDHYSYYENIIEGMVAGFAFSADHSYIMATVKIASSSLGCDISLLPDYIYASIVFDENNVAVCTFINDFTLAEQTLFEGFIKDDSDEIDIESKLSDYLQTFKTDYANYFQGNFTDYYGYISK